MRRTNSLGKNPDAEKDWRQKEKGVAEDEMVEWHHWLKGHECEQLWEIVEDRATWCAAVHGVEKSWTWLSNWTTKTTHELSLYLKGCIRKLSHHWTHLILTTAPRRRPRGRITYLQEMRKCGLGSLPGLAKSILNREQIEVQKAGFWGWPRLSSLYVSLSLVLGTIVPCAGMLTAIPTPSGGTGGSF